MKKIHSLTKAKAIRKTSQRLDTSIKTQVGTHKEQSPHSGPGSQQYIQHRMVLFITAKISPSLPTEEEQFNKKPWETIMKIRIFISETVDAISTNPCLDEIIL